MRKHWQLFIILFLAVLLTITANLFADSQASGNNENNCTNNYCTVKLGNIPVLHIQGETESLSFERRRDIIQNNLIFVADLSLPIKNITFDSDSRIIKINDYQIGMLMPNDELVNPKDIKIDDIDQEKVNLTLNNAIAVYRDNKNNNYMALPDLISLATSIHDKINTYWNIYMAGLVIFVGWLIEKKMPTDPLWSRFIIVAFIVLVIINGFSIFSGYCFLDNVLKEVQYRVNDYPSSFTTEEIKNALKSLSFNPTQCFILFEMAVYIVINFVLLIFFVFFPPRRSDTE
jgi:hypothetical protein